MMDKPTNGKVNEGKELHIRILTRTTTTTLDVTIDTRTEGEEEVFLP